MEVSPNEPFQILCCNQIWKDDNDDPTFDHRMGVLRHGEQYFFRRDSRRKGDIDPTLLSLEPIPITHIRAPFTAVLMITPDLPLDLEDVYTKEPGLVAYGHCSPAEQQAFFEPRLQEAQVYERLRLKPHPNIDIYHGIRKQKKEGVNKGVAHLYALGLAHGDIDPSNIMLDSRINQVVLIDFDSCRPVGKPMGRKAGTTNWSSVDCPEVAELEHDHTALQLIDRLLEDS
ncbi:Uncharacterized protein TCAP_03772 [Tolypocladium capitatum]|uniref:Protein kinase domain-containing protein n=1 Tax=Tolypocladium capitatum TaxID=45235 RepID=A0A2K3QFK9_9HYPO|nr:Uncharacterized protein TCAP_03772 [Tolypocladium capitatum]